MEKQLPEEGDYRLNLAYVFAFDLEEYEKDCLSCQGRIVYDDHKAELVCSKCGLVVREKIETVHDVRTESDGTMPNNSRVSPLKGMSRMRLTVELGNKDSNGKAMNSQFWERMRKVDRRVQCNKSKELADRKGSVLVQRYANHLGLGQAVTDTALHLLVKVNEKQLCKGRVTANFALAALYHACRMHNAARTWQELVELIDNKEYHIDRSNKYTLYHIRGVKKAIRIIEQEFSIKPKPPEMDYLINRVINELPDNIIGMKRDRLLRVALDFWSKVKDEPIMSGKNPQAVAGAAIYIAATMTKLAVPQLYIANLCRMSVVSLRKRVVDIYNLLNLTERPKTMKVELGIKRQMTNGENGRV